MDEIRYWIIDVDGTFTDGGLYYDSYGNEIKKFCTRDAAGLFAASAVGMKTIVLTGRECVATVRRMQELGISLLRQNISNKKQWLEEYMHTNNIVSNQVAYIGDDLNDYQAMKLCGFVACPNDACEEVRSCANYISSFSGGNGAVRDAIEYVLNERGLWKEAIEKAYRIENRNQSKLDN